MEESTSSSSEDEDQRTEVATEQRVEAATPAVSANSQLLQIETRYGYVVQQLDLLTRMYCAEWGQLQQNLRNPVLTLAQKLLTEKEIQRVESHYRPQLEQLQAEVAQLQSQYQVVQIQQLQQQGGLIVADSGEDQQLGKPSGTEDNLLAEMSAEQKIEGVMKQKGEDIKRGQTAGGAKSKSTMPPRELLRKTESDSSRTGSPSPEPLGAAAKGTKKKGKKGAKGKKTEKTNLISALVKSPSLPHVEERLDSEEFPTLGAQAPLSKKQQKELLEGEEKKQRHLSGERQSLNVSPTSPAKMKVSRGQSPRPADYHNYVVGSRAGEKLTRYNILNFSKDDVNQVGLDYIISTSEQGKLVTAEDTEKYILERFQVSHIRELGCRYATEISCVKKLTENQSKVNAYFHAYSLVNAIGTAHDLGESVPKLFEKTSFEELHLGPFVKQPKLRELFGIPPTLSSVPAVTTDDILHHLMSYMDKKKLWTARVNLGQFLTYVQEQYGCETVEQLGVRVKSVGLAISVIKSAQKHQKNWNSEARGKLKNELIEQMDKKLHKLKNQLQESILKDESNTTKKKSQFADMAAADVVLEVFNRCQTIFSANFVDPDYVVSPFLRILSTDEFTRKLFQLCLCTAGDLEIPHLAEDIDSQAEGQGSEMEGEMHAGPTRPTEAVLFKQLSQTLSSYTSAMNLRAMAHMEKRLAQYFGFQDFHSMGHGSFTEFLGHHSKELEELGMASVGGGPGTGQFTATKDSVLQFIRQCGNDLPSDTIGDMLCDQFKVKKPTDLGCGTVQKLVEGAGDGAMPHSVVYYEAASVASQGNSGSHHKTIEEALECLTSAPLLADLSTWSHWEVIFEPQFGPLKTFIEKHSKDCAGNIVKDISDLYCVEMAPGILLRITMTTSDKQFKLALEQGNTRDAAGHLVSIFLRDGGLKNAPLALLANHVTTVLHSMAGKGSIGQIHPGLQEAETAEDVQARLTLDCLTKLPKRICKAVARQVFLEPLGNTVGKAKAYQLLLKVSQCIEDKLCLESLGLSLGISEWTESLWAQMKSSADPMDDSFTQEFSDEESEEELPSDVKPKQEQMEVVSETAEKLLSEAAVDNQQEILMENTERVDSNNTHDVSDASSVEPTQTLETKDEACSEKETKCFNVIQDIRLEKFGIGLELDEKGQKLAQGLNELVGRSLDKLSQELYNKDTHFVLELIQNADDNDYPTAQWSEAGSSECPELVFVVEEDCITLYNNEKGFSERNIRAICDVGQSTKGKHKQGYIGQKGIGFKSVFTVTNTPEIVSNGYCIRFDANSGPTGYILPHWVSEEDRERPHESFYVTLAGGKKSKKKSKVLVDLSDERWTTKITLPLKMQTEQEKLKNRSLTSSFKDVHPSLLLFLNRLKRLIVINKVNKETEVMHRRDLGNGVIEIQTSRKTERWLLHKKVLPVPEELNPSVESTELALAFPLQTDGKTSQGEPPKQDVFAFLPLRCFGFKFVVQGDFEIPASRQDILQDRQWNQWLRSHLPELFVDSLDCFQKHPEFDKISAVVAFLKHVPVEGELYDFFQPVAKQILQLLQGMPCLPVRKEEGSEWKTPTEIVMCKHKGTVEIVSPELLQKYLGKYYLDQAVQKSVSSVLLKNLGVCSIEVKEVVEVLRGVLKDQLNSGRELTILDSALWLACLYHHLEKTPADNYHVTMETILSLPIIPLVNGSVVALSENTVFFSAGKRSSAGKNASASMQAALTVLEQDIPTVHPDVLRSLDGVQNASVKRMLENMGVKHISSEDVIKKHVLPCFASGKWKEKSTDLLLAYVQLIKEQWTSDKQSLNMLEVRRVIQVQLTSGHFVNPQDTTVQLSVEYLSMFDLPSMFPDSVWNIVGSAYLDLSGLSSKQTTSNRQQWKMFLLALGVKEFLAVDKQEVVLKHSELDSSPWAWMKDLFPAYEGRYYIDDQVCPQFDQLTSQVDSPAKYQQMVVLLQALDGLWEAQYANYKLATVYDEDKKELKQVESSFFMNVKKLPWIPSEKGKFGAYRNRGGSIDHLEMENVLLHGSSIYIRYREIESLLGEHVPYLARGINLKSALCKELGIQTFLSNEAILEHLREWSEASSQGQIFLTTVRHMKNVYWHFESRYTADELKELFGQNDFIFVPNEDGATYQTNAFVAGEFLPLKMVCWHDPTGLVQKYGAQGKGAGMTGQKEKYKRELAHVYHDMEAFFRGILQVMETPTMKEYVQLLQEIAEENPVPNHAATLHAYKIFEILGQKCKKKENASGIVGQKGRGILSEPRDASNVELDSIFAGQLKHLLETADVIPTSSNKWVQVQEDPLLADDPRLAELFKKQVAEKILLVAEPVTVVSGIQQSSSEDQVTELRSRAEFFFKAVGIKTLSEGVEQEVVPESTRPSPEVQQYIHKVVPYIQQFLFSFHPTVYKKLQEKKVSAVLKLLLFYQSSKLDVVYRLRDKPRVNVTVQEKCILQNEREFYVHKDSVKSYRDMDKELVKIFLPASAQDLETGLLNFLQVLRMHIQKPDGGMTDADFQREQKMKALPEEEERWAVPEPDQLLIRPSQKTESKEHPLDDLNWTEKDEKAKKKKNPPEAGELTSWPPPPPKEKMGPPTDSVSERSQPQATGKPSTGSAPISEPLHLHVKDGDTHASQRAQKDHGPFSQVGTSPVLPQIQPSSGQNQVTKADSRDAPIDQGQSSSTTEDDSVGRPVDKTGQVVNQRPEQTQHVPDSVPTVQHQALPQFGVPSQFGFSVPGPQVDPSHHHQQGSQDMGSRGGESDLFSLFSSPPRSLGPALFGPGDSIEQVQYEDTTSINIETALPPVAEVLVGDKKHIGEWGEKWVNSFLQAKFREQIEKKYLVIHWVNEKQESGKPFDFCIEWIAEEKQVFIEVKSTFAENKDMFEISSQELKAAQKLKKNYQIYRVYNAGNSFQPVKLRVLENVLQLLDSKAIKMSMWL